MTETNQAKIATEEIEWSVVSGENTEFAVQYPRMQWAHGDKKASGFNKTGGLFLHSDQSPYFEADDFKQEVLITRKADVQGFGAALAHLAVIRIKHQWIKEDGRNVPLVHVLAVPKGTDSLICISLRGASKALEFQSAFNQHMSHNVALANRGRPSGANPIEPFALWFPVKAGEIEIITSKDGKNESSVTQPQLAQPETLDKEYLKSLWVGGENYKLFASYYRETAAWQKSPIWEQRGADTPEVPEYAGTEEGLAQDGQLRTLINLSGIKNMPEKELAIQVSGGKSVTFEGLSVEEAQNAIELLKSY